MLSLIIFFPALAALLGLLIDDKSSKIYGLGVAVLQLVFVLGAWHMADFSSGGYSLLESVPLLPSIGVNYIVGVDAISLSLIALASLVGVVAMAAMPNSRFAMFFVLCFLSSMIGAFASIDAILFYTFWELNLIPSFFLIGFKKSRPDSYKAALKFFIYGFGGSVFLLAGIIYMAYLSLEQLGSFSFNILEWAEVRPSFNAQIWLFLAFGISFAIKSPLFPFHSWLPSAHAAAPSVASVLLALKMGTYGFIRFSLPFFADAAVYFAPLMCVLGIITIIYCAFVAFAQDDIKLVIAYSTISHAGLVVLAIFSLSSLGTSGAVFLMLAHGLVAAMIFWLIGILSKQTGVRAMADYGGLAKSMPLFSSLFALAMLSFVGLPLTAGFVGEFIALLAAFNLKPAFAVFGGVAIIVGAVYMLHLFKELIFGVARRDFKLKDICAANLLLGFILSALILLFGIYPALVIDELDKASSLNSAKMLKSASENESKTLLSKLNEGVEQ